MKRLIRKMFRDMWQAKAQFISIFIMCFLGILIYSGIEGVWNGMEVQEKQYFKETNLADFWINGINFNSEELKDIKGIDGVISSQLSSVVEAYTDNNHTMNIRISANKGNFILKPIVLKGKPYNDENSEIWIDADYAKIKHLSIGDNMKLYYHDKNVVVKVQGLVYSPEYISYTGATSALMPDHGKYSYGFVSDKTMSDLCGDVEYNQIKLKLKNNDNNTRLKADLKSQLAGHYLSGVDRSEWSGISNYVNKIGQIKKMSIMFSLVFLILALLTIQTTMKRIVKKQRSQIGILKALGFYDYQIKLHYSLYGLFSSTIGVVCGLIIAPYTVTPMLLHLQEKFYSMPKWKGEISYISYVLAILMVIVCVITAFWACFYIAKELPANLLRDESPLHGKKLILENVKSLWSHIDFNWKWSLRDMFQNKSRTLIGIIGVLGSMMLLMASFGIQDSINAGNKNVYGNQYTYYEQIKMQSAPNKNDIDKIQSLLQGEMQWISQITTELQSQSTIKSENLLILDKGFYVKLEDKAGNTIRLPKEGVILSEKTAADMNVKIGDIIKINNTLGSYTAYVYKIININSPQGIFISKEAWETVGGTFTPNVLLAGDSSNLKNVESMNCVGEITKLHNQLDDVNEVLNNVLMIILLLLVAAIILSVVILYNLGLLSYAERSRDYATLRVLGFYNNEIRDLIFKDTIINVFIGWIVGIPIGFAFLSLYVRSISTSSFQYSAHLDVSSFIISSVITIGCSFLVSYIVSRKVAKIDMVESLKAVE